MAAYGILVQSYFYFYFYFYISISLLFFPPMLYSLSESDALLKLKQSFTNAERLSSWVVGSQPCAQNIQWIGLVCSNNGFVTGLHLRDMGLSGKIDVLALKELKDLRIISFVNNGFSGPIPEFNILGALKGIFLSGNQFSGEIPSEYFANMKSLKKLWLSDNKFIGRIPTTLTKLNNLIELHLENNQFNGIIPALNTPSLASLNFSNNKLEGEIPTTLSKFNSSSFDGNVRVCGGELGKECPKSPVPNNNQPTKEQTEPTKTNDKSSNGQDNLSKIIVSASIIGGLVLISLVVSITFMSKRKENKEKKIDKFGKENGDDAKVEVTVAPVTNNKGVDAVPMRRARTTNSSRRSNQGKGGVGGGCGGLGELIVVNDEKGVFGLQDLMKASAEVLGNGSIGSSYKALMSKGLTVVVKRTPAMNTKGKEDFDAHMRMLGRLKHVNVLTPLAYHYRKDEKLLVCEHVPKGSLLYVLHGDHPGENHVELNWAMRLKIVKGIAKGLGFLHTNLPLIDVPHGNLKSSNILLASNCEPLLSDFGHSLLISSEHKTQALFAYRTPEALQSIPVSPKNDVYCLGIVILEILTGKFPSQYLNNGQDGTDIVQWVSSAISEGRELELLDPEIEIESENAQVEMDKLIHIGAACTESNPELRLDMMEAIRRIEEIQVRK